MSSPTDASSTTDAAPRGTPARPPTATGWTAPPGSGFVAKGLVYALIGVLAIQVAFGDSERTDQKGALQSIAEKPGGSIVLWLMVLGFLAYAGWRFSEAAWGRRDETDEKKRTAKRLGSAANGLVYLVLRGAGVPHRHGLLVVEQHAPTSRPRCSSGRAARRWS